MTAPDNWADYAALAEFVPGQMYDGVEAIEFQIGYGETSVAWNLDDLPAGEEVLIGMDLNIDFFGTQTALALAALPGTLTAEDAQDPREEINAAVAAEFADADPGKPDTTNGWQTVTLPVTADADGNATLFLIVGRAAENPPLVFGAFTNPTVIE
jgi:hypothetical protein